MYLKYSSIFLLNYAVICYHNITQMPFVQCTENIIKTKKHKIAIIGSGIAGSFTAKYLTDYDSHCSLDITIFDTYIPSCSSPSKNTKGTSVNSDVKVSNENDKSSSESKSKYQESRVSSISLQDGSIIELGASIIHSENKLVRSMMEGNSTCGPLLMTPPHSIRTTTSESTSDNTRGETRAMGIYNGKASTTNETPLSRTTTSESISASSSWPLVLNSKATPQEKKMELLKRYNFDLYKINQITQKTLQAFTSGLYPFLESKKLETFTQSESPDDIWRAIGLDEFATNVSFDRLLDNIGVSKGLVDDGNQSTVVNIDDDELTKLSWLEWFQEKIQTIKSLFSMNTIISFLSMFHRLLFPHQKGLLRQEILSAMNICNNNKNNKEMSALAGLVNFAATTGSLFAIQGGNSKLIRSALDQAISQHAQTCRKVHFSNEDDNHSGNESDKLDYSFVRHVIKRVQTVVSDQEENGIMALYDASGQKLGLFDIVILAAPLQFSDLNLLVRGSLFDSHILHEMPLNGHVMNGDDGDLSPNANDHDHRGAWNGLPSSAKRSYTQVVTTVIRHGVLSENYFDLVGSGLNDHDRNVHDVDMDASISILFTEKGRKETGLSAVTRLNKLDGLFKVFSSEELTDIQIHQIFGDNAVREYIQVWGGKYGGATPDFNSCKNDSTKSTKFLLYDGQHGMGVGTTVVGDESRGSALYYVNAMEAAVSAIEISAIGAKAVSKLVARRLGLIVPDKSSHDVNEL